MSKRKVTRTAERKGRELLERLRPRFPALFPADQKDLKPWAVGEGRRLHQAVAEGGETVSSQVWHVLWRPEAPHRLPPVPDRRGAAL